VRLATIHLKNFKKTIASLATLSYSINMMINNQNQDTVKMTIAEFVARHASDDIVYALTHREYFKLSEQEHTELFSFVFKAIDSAR
jgi:hypothetical protein